jgi:predicted ATP-grasp superfamily ATP-dependent carboligase
MSCHLARRSGERGLLLLVGVDVAALAVSAHRAGYRVHVVDVFGDRECRAFTERSLSIVEQVSGRSCGRFEAVFSPEALLNLAEKLARDYSYDGVILSSGLEDSPESLSRLEDIAPLLGNTRQAISGVRDRKRFHESLSRLGIHGPMTLSASNVVEAKEAAQQLGYPVVLKPNVGFGGANIHRALNEEELVRITEKRNDGFLVQQYVEGVAASTSLIATQDHSVAVTVNRQILGVASLGAPGAFAYCGNIVPHDDSEKVNSRCRKVSEKVVEAFGLVGSNGVDLVIDHSGQPWVIEVNPRFQGTLECVETVLGANLVEAHLAASLRNRLPKLGKAKGYCVRLILYSREPSLVPDLRQFSWVRDIPIPGVIVERNEPLCSVVATGDRAGPALLKSAELGEAVYSSLQRLECL